MRVCAEQNMSTKHVSVLLLVLVHLPNIFTHLFSLNELKYSSATGYEEEISLLTQVFNFLQGSGYAELY